MSGWCCGCGGGLAVLVVAVFLLILAVSVTNRMLGPAKVRSRTGGAIPEWDWDDWDEDDPAPQVRRVGPGVIPEPGFFKGGVSVFLTALLWGLAFILMGFAAEEQGLRMRHVETRLAAAVVTLPVAYLTLTVMLALLLPTPLRRAALAAFVYGLIILALIACVGAVVTVLVVVFD